MSTTRTFDPSEPRRPQDAKPYDFGPVSKNAEWLADFFGVVALSTAGSTMVTRQPLFAWIALVAAIASINNSKPMSKERKADAGGMYSGWSSLMFAITAIFSSYLPIFLGHVGPDGRPILPATPAGAAAPQPAA